MADFAFGHMKKYTPCADVYRLAGEKLVTLHANPLAQQVELQVQSFVFSPFLVAHSWHPSMRKNKQRLSYIDKEAKIIPKKSVFFELFYIFVKTTLANLHKKIIEKSLKNVAK